MVLRKIKSDADIQHLQDYVNKLTEWSEKWQMLCNFEKCKCLHTGHGNEDAQYVSVLRRCKPGKQRRHRRRETARL